MITRSRTPSAPWRTADLSHAVANHFAAAKFGFLARSRQVFFDLDEQFGIGQANAVARGGPIEVGVLAAWNFQTHVCAAL